MFCGLSIATPLVLPPPQPWDYSPPGSVVVLLCCCGFSRLAVMLNGHCSAVAGGVCGCSVRELLDFCCRFTPVSIAGTGSLRLLCRPPLCARSFQMQVHIQTEGAVPGGADGGVDGCAAVPSILTDRRSLCFVCFHLCLFHFVKFPWVP